MESRLKTIWLQIGKKYGHCSKKCPGSRTWLWLLYIFLWAHYIKNDLNFCCCWINSILDGFLTLQRRTRYSRTAHPMFAGRNLFFGLTYRPSAGWNLFCGPTHQPSARWNLFCEPTHPPSARWNLFCGLTHPTFAGWNLFCGPTHPLSACWNRFHGLFHPPSAGWNLFCRPTAKTIAVGLHKYIFAKHQRGGAGHKRAKAVRAHWRERRRVHQSARVWAPPGRERD